MFSRNDFLRYIQEYDNAPLCSGALPPANVSNQNPFYANNFYKHRAAIIRFFQAAATGQYNLFQSSVLRRTALHHFSLASKNAAVVMVHGFTLCRGHECPSSSQNEKTCP